MAIGTKFNQEEPIGFGRAPFGNPKNNKIDQEYGRGFGDATTKHKAEDSGAGTSYTAYTDD